MPAPETNGHTPPSLPDPKVERRLDLDALAPVPLSRYTVQYQGVEYGVRQMMDLDGDEELQLAALDEKVDAGIDKSTVAMRRAMFDRAYAMIRILVPDMPPKVRNSLKYVAALEVAKHAWAYAREPANPPAAPVATDGAPGPETPSSAPAESLKSASPASSVATPAS